MKYFYSIILLLSIIIFATFVSAQEQFNWGMFLPALTVQHECSTTSLRTCLNITSCQGAGGYWYDDQCHTTEPPPILPADRLQFSMNGLIGIVTTGVEAKYKAAGVSSPVKGIDNKGNIVDIANENQPVKDYFFGPEGEVYLIFSGQYSYKDDSGNPQNSILMKVDQNNNYTNLDSTMVSIEEYGAGGSTLQNSKGSQVCYRGNTHDGQEVIRKNKNGTKKDFTINENILLFHWVVGLDGSIFIQGHTLSNDMDWFRKVRPDGSLVNIFANDVSATFLEIFSDGKVYFWGYDALGGLAKMLPAEESFTEKCYLSNGGNGGMCGTEGVLGNENISDQLCAENGETDCSLTGTPDRTFLVGNAIFAWFDSTGKIWKYFPELSPVNITSIPKIRLFSPSDNVVYAYGLTEFSQNRTIRYDLTTGSEIELLPDHDIEIYHLNAADDGKLWFDGLRFLDTSYVIGYIDEINANEVVFTSTTNSKLEDFKIISR